MEKVKQQPRANVVEIKNGFMVDVSWKEGNDNYFDESYYFKNLNQVAKFLKQFFAVPPKNEDDDIPF